MKIAVRTPNWLGDLVMSMPFLHLLGSTFPDAEVVIIAKPALLPLLELLPYPVTPVPFHKLTYPGLAGIVSFAWSRQAARRADVYFALPPSFSAALMGFCLGARHRVGYRGDGRAPLLTHKAHPAAGQHRGDALRQLIGVYTGRQIPPGPLPVVPPLAPLPAAGEPASYLVLNPNSQADSRRLPVVKWHELLASLPPSRYVLIGTATDREYNRRLISRLPKENEYLDLAGQTTILELARLLAHARGLISNDSGPAHLAAYVGAKVVVFMGAGDPEETAPQGPNRNVLVLTAGVACAPCIKNECPLGTLACLTDLDMPGLGQRIRDFF